MRTSLKERYSSAIGKGSFFPATLLLSLNNSEAEFYLGGDLGKNRVLHHEYLHFVQRTTTPYGFNCFLRDLDVLALSLGTARLLFESSQRARLPIKLDGGCPASVMDKLDGLLVLRRKIIEDMALLQGAYKYDVNTASFLFQGRPVSNPSYCQVLRYEDASMLDPNVPLGTRAIMESAASTHESFYLELMSGGDDEAWRQLLEWSRTKDSDPVYYVLHDLFNSTRKDSKNFRCLLAILADLSLCGPVEWNLDDWAKNIHSPAERSPTLRLLAALEAAAEIPDVDLLLYQAEYYKVVEAICTKLRWQRPWEVMGTNFVTLIRENIYAKAIFTDYSGFEAIFINGFALRKQKSHFCALPLDFFQKGEEVANRVKLIEGVILAHPPPNTNFEGGNGPYADFADKTYGNFFSDPAEFRTNFNHSLSSFSMAKQLEYLILGEGVDDNDGCLLDANNPLRVNKDCSLCLPLINGNDCPCRKLFRLALGKESDEVQWQ